MFSSTRSRFRQATMGFLLFALGLAAVSAHATIYRGRFDPLFGPPLVNPDIGWRGESQFSISTACFEGGSPGSIVDTASVQGCEAKVQGSRIEFYVAGQEGLPTLATATFDQDITITRFFYVAPEGPQVIKEIEAGLATFLFPVDADSKDGTSLEDLFGNNQYLFSLRFDLNSSAKLLNNPEFDPRRENGPLLFARQGVGCETCNIPSRNRPTTFDITEGTASFDVPEPGTLALVVGALGLAGFARRRHAKA